MRVGMLVGEGDGGKVEALGLLGDAIARIGVLASSLAAFVEPEQSEAVAAHLAAFGVERDKLVAVSLAAEAVEWARFREFRAGSGRRKTRSIRSRKK